MSDKGWGISPLMKDHLLMLNMMGHLFDGWRRMSKKEKNRLRKMMRLRKARQAIIERKPMHHTSRARWQNNNAKEITDGKKAYYKKKPTVTVKPNKPNKEISHREVYRKHHGQIPPGWIVYRIDQKQRNNEISNLIAMPQRVFTMLHRHISDKRSGALMTRSEVESWLSSLEEVAPSLFDGVSSR